MPEVPEDSVRLLPSLDGLDLAPLPPDLRSELEDAIEVAPVCAAYADGCPVAFCYVGARTESLWDVSRDTLEGYRRRGYAARCVAFMVEHQQRESPVHLERGGVQRRFAGPGAEARLRPGARDGGFPSTGQLVRRAALRYAGSGSKF